jgi:hypothetical protein
MPNRDRDLLIAILHEDFLAFVARAFDEVEPRVKLAVENYIRLLAHVLTALAAGDTKRLILNPRLRRRHARRGQPRRRGALPSVRQAARTRARPARLRENSELIWTSICAFAGWFRAALNAYHAEYGQHLGTKH